MDGFTLIWILFVLVIPIGLTILFILLRRVTAHYVLADGTRLKVFKGLIKARMWINDEMVDEMTCWGSHSNAVLNHKHGEFDIFVRTSSGIFRQRIQVKVNGQLIQPAQ